MKKVYRRDCPRKGNWASSKNARSDHFRQLRQSESAKTTVWRGNTPYVKTDAMSWHEITRYENTLLSDANKAAQAKVVWERKISNKIRTSIKPYGGQ